MRAFIEISKFTRNQYIKQLPFIYAMCKKEAVIEDIKTRIDGYLRFKENQGIL